jgi:phosphohistidine phosphatase
VVRRLLLMRHAKSDWDASYDADHDRPLAGRGERSARAMGEALREMGEIPDLIVSSTAVRAESTAELARLAGGWPCPLHLDGDLYGAGPAEVLAVAARHGGRAERLMLVGHEPTWSGLVNRLTGARASVKTGTVAGIDLDLDRWEDAPGAQGSLVFLIHPRMVMGRGER